MRSSRLLPLLLALSFAVTACGGSGSGSPARGASSSRPVAATSSVPADSFSVEGKAARVGGAEVYVFDYPTVKAARVDSAKLSVDAKTIGGKPLPWKDGTPRFFREDKTIVLYLGADEKVLTILKSQYGEAFAGPEAAAAAVAKPASSAAASAASAQAGASSSR